MLHVLDRAISEPLREPADTPPPVDLLQSDDPTIIDPSAAPPPHLLDEPLADPNNPTPTPTSVMSDDASTLEISTSALYFACMSCVGGHGINNPDANPIAASPTPQCAQYQTYSAGPEGPIASEEGRDLEEHSPTGGSEAEWKTHSDLQWACVSSCPSCLRVNNNTTGKKKKKKTFFSRGLEN
jgi:hypothetical protein